MEIRNRFMILALVMGATTFSSAGCNSTPQSTSPEAAVPPAAPAVAPEIQNVADAVLGKQAEVLAHGDLARTGSEQLLVINRLANTPRASGGPGSPSEVMVTRAAVVEKNGDRWAEMLRCDEHLKNPKGYLGGAPAGPVTGWRLEVDRDTPQGLELRFTPAEGAQGRGPGAGDTTIKTIAVRWNRTVKRYQSLNRSHQGYLSEILTLETPESILR
jgi:hypothetical protein